MKEKENNRGYNMKWFVMKKMHENYTENVYHKASKFFSTKKQAESEMKKLKRKHPKIFYKIGGET